LPEPRDLAQTRVTPPAPSPGAVHEIAHPSRDGAAKPRDSPSQPGYRMEPSNGLLGRISMDSTFA